MLLNFMLSEEVRHLCGVDVSNVKTDNDWERGSLGGWERWDRKIMGQTDYPYHDCQAVRWFKTISLGDRKEKINPLIWERVVSNFPGSEGYDCGGWVNFYQYIHLC